MTSPGRARSPLAAGPSRRWLSRAFCLAAAVAMLLVVAPQSPWRVTTSAADAPLPEITQPLTDVAGVVDAQSARSIDQLSRALLAASGDTVVVVTVPSFAPYGDIREYATKLFENHGKGIGNNATAKEKDSGVLILLSVQERRVWIEVGYGLEQWITDGFSGQTSRDVMVPSFRTGSYGAGLVNGMARIVGRIAEGRNVTLTGVQIPRAQRSVRSGSGLPPWVIIIVFLAIIALSRSGGGPGGGVRQWGQRGGWSSGVGPFGGGFGGRSGGGGGGAGW